MDELIDLEDEPPIKWYKLCKNPEKEMEKGLSSSRNGCEVLRKKNAQILQENWKYR